MAIPRNPLLLLAGKQRMGKKIADQIEQTILVALTCAKHSQGSAADCNTLQTHLMVAAYVWNVHKNEVMYNKTVKAFNSLIKAATRDTVLLDLSTTEYKDLCAALIPYIAAFPKIEVSLMVAASQQVDKDMKKERP